MDGTTAHDGRVEVRKNNGQWSSISCIEYWDIRCAYVVCHMLNYTKAVSTGTANVKGSGPIVSKLVYCDGNEISIEQCYHQTVSGCDHSHDVAVVCGNLTSGKVKSNIASGSLGQGKGEGEIVAAQAKSNTSCTSLAYH